MPHKTKNPAPLSRYLYRKSLEAPSDGGDKRDRTADLGTAHAAHPPKADLLYCKRSAVRLPTLPGTKKDIRMDVFFSWWR